MTVAAVILAASPGSALADADGLAAVRRIADVAWSGGATPIVVGSFDPDGGVAAALAGAPVTLAAPAPVEGGPVAQIRRVIDVARAEISGTDAALVWPARITWVGPETVTSLIEAHGLDPDAILRPAYDGEAGWPVLVPVAHAAALATIASDRLPGDVIDDLAATGIRVLELELGDPGTTHDRSTALSDLPPYVGPSEPARGHSHEWGAEVAATADDGPLEGPSLAPYPPADPG
ncbi:MAG: NTP transferase domain-containing protein [Chloroflexi bacterium]|nr:NTP transferase domain-containing protein [Chloroflexota bacterium]